VFGQFCYAVFGDIDLSFQRMTSFAVSVVCCWLVATGVVRGEWHNTLKPPGAPAGEIVLVKDGKSVRPILLPMHATTIEKNAATELQHWIEQITTARPEITTANRGPSVRLQTDASLGEEGYRIAMEGDDLVLTGGTGRGAINAVYALLEEDLGCRFYTTDSIKLPKGTTLTVRPVARSFTPKLRLRDPFYQVAFDSAWSLRNRTNAPLARVSEEFGGRIDYDGLFVHTHAKLLPPDKYFAGHPDYFALNSSGNRYTAQLCPTHPEVAKIVTQAVLDTLKKNPRTEIVSVSKNDSAGDQICYCDRCRKIRGEEGSEIGCQLVLVNAVAEAVEKEYPHVVIDTLAYLDTVQPPKHMRPRANVVIRLCNDRVGAMTHPFTPAEKCEIAQTIAGWSKIHKRIYIWDYNANFAHYLAPMPNVDVMADNIRFWVKNHAEGVMLEGGNMGPADGDEMKSWVTSKLLWDPSRDEKALVQDFIWGHYGPAAPALAEYEELLNGLRKTHAAEMASPTGGINYRMDSPFFTKDFVSKAANIFARAKQLATGDEQLLRRVERAELPILYVKCWRGPKFAGPSYADDVADFERIARRVGVRRLSEGRDNFDTVLTVWKQRISKSPPKKS
jgi:Domain of unknown function (DUF4838)/Glycosyl hydrolase family 20, domain 2